MDIKGLALGGEKHAYVFLVLCIIFGLAWTFLVPPFQLPDEDAHFFRAWSVSDGKIFTKTVKGPDGKPAAGEYLPADMVGLPDSMGAHMVRRNPFNKYDFGNFWKFMGRLCETRPDYSKRVFADTSAEMYSPVPYLPQVAGIVACRALGAGPLVCYYAARIFVMLAYALLVFLAVKVTPVGKNLFVIVGLLPMSVALSVSVGADAVSNGAAFLFSAYMLRLSLTDRHLPLTRGKLAAVFGLLAVIALLKQPYLLLALLVLAVPAERFGNRRARYVFAASALLFTLAVSAAWNVPAIVFASAHAQAAGPSLLGDPAGQVGFILTHPLGYLTALYNGIFHYVLQAQGRGLWRQFLGLLGWLDLVFPAFFYDLLGLFLLAQLLFSQGTPRIPAGGRAVLFFTSLAAAAGVATAMYLVNPVGSDSVTGLQGRYFTPIAPLALVSLSHSGLDAFETTAFKVFRGPLVVGAVMAATLSFATWQIFLRYFG
jgi:uncharacterized membrane protein